MSKKTPLYQQHIDLGAKMCPFAGYDMPIQYALGVIKEHEWTRTSAGLFDVSHMGQALVNGDKAAEFFSTITPSNFTNTSHTLAKYTVLTNERGGIIDDLIITRLGDNQFFVVYNAARKEVDEAWMEKNLPAGVTFEALRDRALIALQGPKAEAILSKEFPSANLSELGYMRITSAAWQGTPVFISRLGYTGEDGFEISIPSDKASAFWSALLAHQEVEAVGLAARDSLRLEMGYPLYGHDLDEDTTPIEAGLGWVVGKDHSGFIGAEKILAQKAGSTDKKRIGIKLTGSGIAREGTKIFDGATEIGIMTSGGFSPSLKASIGQGYVPTAHATEGKAVEVEVRGKRIAAEITSFTFMEASTKKPQKKAS